MSRAEYSRRASRLAERLAQRYGRSVLTDRAAKIAVRARAAGRLSQPSDPETVARFLWLVSYRNELLRLSH